jgi:uncharacterized protein YndB with AHSA1/START domain
MPSTRTMRHVNAPRAKVYRALLDARAVETWMVPTGMTSRVHEFDARERGLFRISPSNTSLKRDARGKAASRLLALR